MNIAGSQIRPRPLVMGVLNVTPDSFSDGGEFIDPSVAVAHALELVHQGADIIDVGGESTRPGAVAVSPAEEQRRVLPVVRALSEAGLVVSIDTINAATAQLAVAAGAQIINDVSGGTRDPEMFGVAASTGARIILMHWRGIPDPAHAKSHYRDVVEEVRAELEIIAQSAIAAGIERAKIVLDPGLGFDKTAAQGWELLEGIDRLKGLGYPLLIGVSRKRMLRETVADDASRADLDTATAMVSAFCARQDVWGVRVHNVRATDAALRVAGALAEGRARNIHPTETAQKHETLEASSTQPISTKEELMVSPRVADRITLTGLEVFAHHGYYEFEREQGQRFVIDAEVSLSVRDAAAGDELALTVNYAELAEAIVQAVSNDPVDLIETVAERVANVVLGFEAVSEAKITVHKPEAPIDAKFTDVAVTIVRYRGEL